MAKLTLTYPKMTTRCNREGILGARQAKHGILPKNKLIYFKVFPSKIQGSSKEDEVSGFFV